MKKLIAVFLALLFVFSLTSVAVSAETADTSGSDEPVGFMGNLKYMGLGMFGIFLVIGVVIVITYLLNAITSKKTK